MANLTDQNRLSLMHPELAAQWHPTKNGSLTPHDFTFASNKKIWWKCPVAEDHEWEAVVNSRSQGSGCPCCSGRLVVPSNCLMTTHPDLSAQWHPIRNGSLTPRDVTFGSTKRVWWKCPVAEDHEWEDSLNTRTNMRTGCVCCSGRLAVPSNCLMTTHPYLSDQWHPTKNGSLTPYNVVAGSNRKVWWQCQIVDDHEWEAVVSSRAYGGYGCSCCAGRTVVISNCLAMTHSELADQWHPTKNGSLTPYNTLAGSNRKVWWKCPVADDHEWEASLLNRTKHGHGCSCCASKIVVISNCLATTHSELADQWHPTKNGSLTPYDVVAGSVRRIWWKCSIVDGHEWEVGLTSRSRGSSGCPYCNESHGEKRIKSILSQKGYRFEREVRFDDCKCQRHLPFDFRVLVSDGNWFLIEFQGIQHYESTRFVSSRTWEESDTEFEMTQKRDWIKKQYAEDRGIPLLVIPYWNMQIMESLIEDFIRDVIEFK